jgi:hypothetical protein
MWHRFLLDPWLATAYLLLVFGPFFFFIAAYLHSVGIACGTPREWHTAIPTYFIHLGLWGMPLIFATVLIVVRLIRGGVLHYAARSGQHESIKSFIAQGFNLDSRNLLGETALHLAAKHGHTESVRALLEHSCGVNCVDCHGQTALHLAAQIGCVEVVILLLEHGARKDLRDQKGKTAADIGNSDVSSLLSG